MTLNQFMRKIGYIGEKNLVTVALEVYDKENNVVYYLKLDT